MAGGKNKIHLHPKVNTNGFDKRPEDAGRPPKKYSQHIKELREMGYEAPTKAEYFDLVGLLLAMEEIDLLEFEQDKTRPYWIRLIAQDLENKFTRSKIMSDHRDWLFGRAGQKTEIVATVAEQKPGLDVSKLSTELLLQLKEAYEIQRSGEQENFEGNKIENMGESASV